jgi:hypothetical protein
VFQGADAADEIQKHRPSRFSRWTCIGRHVIVDSGYWCPSTIMGKRREKGDRRGVVGGLFHVSAWRGLVSGSDGKERDHHEVNDTRSTTEYARFHG